MIRFIDLGDQLLYGDPHFAWFDTVSDMFIEYSGEMVWDNWKDFEASFNCDAINQSEYLLGGDGKLYIENTRPIDRFKGLFPKDWPNHTRNTY